MKRISVIMITAAILLSGFIAYRALATAGKNKKKEPLLIAVSNNKTQTLDIYRYDDTLWTDQNRVWRFKPTAELGYSAEAIRAYDTPGDQRLHNTTGFPGKATAAFAIDGHTWVGVIAYKPSRKFKKGQMLWETYFREEDNPNMHAVELLPNGNIAVAAVGHAVPGKGNWVRVYNTSDPKVTDSYAEVPLTGAHAVRWDPHLKVLWAGGRIEKDGRSWHGIFAYKISGTRGKPVLTEMPEMRSVKPFGKQPSGFKWPHDISPDYDNPDRLIYGDHSGVYFYSKSAKAFTPVPGVANRKEVPIKSVAIVPGGQYIMLTEAVNTGSCRYTNSKVDFYDLKTGAYAFSRSVTNGCTIYRARIWTSRY